MPISEQQLAAAIGAARGIVQREAPSRSRSQSPRGDVALPPPSYNTSLDEAWGIPTDMQMSQDYGQISESYSNAEPGAEYDQANFTDTQIQESQLPEAVKQSFLNERISNGSSNISALDRLGIKPAPKPKPVTEQYQQYQPSYNGGFDYTAMKAIIKECLNEYFNSNSLNENNLKTIKLKGGKINLIDNKGNIYSAVLEQKGNINDKK